MKDMNKSKSETSDHQIYGSNDPGVLKTIADVAFDGLQGGVSDDCPGRVDATSEAGQLGDCRSASKMAIFLWEKWWVS